MTIIDTSVMIPLLNGSPGTVEKIRDVSKQSGPLTTTIITVYEVLKGACLSTKRESNLRRVKEALHNMLVLDLSPDACEEASIMFSKLRDEGKTVSEFDILIAAIAKVNDEALLTRDKHFRMIDEIKLIEW